MTCCEWCGNVFSPIGWCMPITGKPVPSLTCTKVFPSPTPENTPPSMDIPSSKKTSFCPRQAKLRALPGRDTTLFTLPQSPEGCEAIKVEATCESYDLCAWLPIGPPGSGMGTCLFNWAKCTAPSYP